MTSGVDIDDAASREEFGKEIKERFKSSLDYVLCPDIFFIHESLIMNQEDSSMCGVVPYLLRKRTPLPATN